jgi:hypothetical protein
MKYTSAVIGVAPRFMARRLLGENAGNFGFVILDFGLWTGGLSAGWLLFFGSVKVIFSLLRLPVLHFQSLHHR